MRWPCETDLSREEVTRRRGQVHIFPSLTVSIALPFPVLLSPPDGLHPTALHSDKTKSRICSASWPEAGMPPIIRGQEVQPPITWCIVAFSRYRARLAAPVRPTQWPPSAKQDDRRERLNVPFERCEWYELTLWLPASRAVNVVVRCRLKSRWGWCLWPSSPARAKQQPARLLVP